MSGNVDWNTNEYEASKGFAVLPKGRYLAIVDNSESKKTRDGTGTYFEFKFTCLKDPAKNRKLWARLNVHNPSKEAQRIGREQFNALVLAAGMENVKDTAQLHNKVVVLIVDIENGTKGEQNRITGFLKPSAEDSQTPRPEVTRPAIQHPKRQPAPAGDVGDDDIPF